MTFYPCFVDYLTIRQQHPQRGLPVINNGHFFRIDPDGEIEYSLSTRLGIEGSYDSRVEIRCDGSLVEFSGNISRFGRTDNLFGYSFSESIEKINKLLARFNLPPFTSGKIYDFNGSGWTWSGARVSRIDITCNYSTGSMQDSEALLRTMAGHHVGRQKGCLPVNGTTIEYGRGSKFVYGKLYCKPSELLKHKSKKSGQHVTQEVINYCLENGIVREEFTLKSRFLLQNNLAFLGAVTDEKLHEVYMNRTQLQRLDNVKYDDFTHLPRHLKATYVSWKYGYPMNLTTATFYRHRTALLPYGIDISIPNNVQTLPINVRVINLQPLAMPDWYARKYA